ncbi:MAG: MaoC family dehydratase N-terminal domain-containing protein [Chloroflexi bacterium]|nr:MaoC family dehydratase N-terminal domain-containing protein [Chloroflexota bacterium]
MATQSRLTPAMKAEVNKPPVTKVSPPISLSDIRKWAIAVYWPETPPRLFWDEEYAKTTRFKGIVAPQEFNPFAWPVRRDREFEAGGNPPPNPDGTFTRTVGNANVNAGSDHEYGAYMRPGDIITAVDRLAEIYEKTGGRGGNMVFRVREDRWTNQKGEMVKINRGTTINM